MQLRVFGALDCIFGDEVAQMDVEDYRNSFADAKPTSDKKIWLDLFIQRIKHN